MIEAVFAWTVKQAANDRSIAFFPIKARPGFFCLNRDSRWQMCHTLRLEREREREREKKIMGLDDGLAIWNQKY